MPNLPDGAFRPDSGAGNSAFGESSFLLLSAPKNYYTRDKISDRPARVKNLINCKNHSVFLSGIFFSPVMPCHSFSVWGKIALLVKFYYFYNP